jgi:hypothetical protein
MTPEKAVGHLVQILWSSSGPAEDAIYRAMAIAGVPARVADRAYKFALMACGCVFLSELGVRFANEYMCLNAQGDIVEQGALENEPHFAEAMRIARRAPDRALMSFALLSADVQAVNEALKAGSEARHLQLATPLLFMEPPTPAGFDRARRIAAGQIGVPQTKQRKPWWRFW